MNIHTGLVFQSSQRDQIDKMSFIDEELRNIEREARSIELRKTALLKYAAQCVNDLVVFKLDRNSPRPDEEFEKNGFDSDIVKNFISGVKFALFPQDSDEFDKIKDKIDCIGVFADDCRVYAEFEHKDSNSHFCVGVPETGFSYEDSDMKYDFKILSDNYSASLVKSYVYSDIAKAIVKYICVEDKIKFMTDILYDQITGKKFIFNYSE